MHIRAGMIAPVCIYVPARSRICGTRACGNVNTKSKQDKTKGDQLERHDIVYAHTCASMFMRRSGQLFRPKEGT